MKNITEQDWQPILIAFSNNDFNKVLTLAENLINKFPKFAFAYKAKGVALYQLNNKNSSIVYLTKAYELDNSDLDVINNLTTALSRSDSKEHWEFSKKILENSIYNKKICDIKTYFNLLITTARFGEWNNVEKLSISILNFIESNGNKNLLNNNEIYEIYSLLTQAKLRQEKYDEAMNFANLMKKYNYTYEVDVYISQCIDSQKKYIELASFLEQANKNHPNNFKLMIMLAKALNNIGDIDISISIFDKVEQNFILNNNQKNTINLSLDDKIFFYSELLGCIHYSPKTNISTLKKCAHKLMKLLEIKYKTNKKFDFTKLKKSKPSTLNIGLVSGDFNSHVVSLFLRNLLPHLIKYNINIYIYMNRNLEDSVSEELKTYSKKWTQIFDLTDEETANKIYSDNIHILIDLSGYTKYNRLPVFALKPAPIQISWIGWLGTTGIPTMDYFLADEFCVPRGEKYEQQFCEKILRMPHIWEVLTPPDSENLPPPRKNNFCFTFASFNNPNKVNSKTLDLWCEILRKSPKNTEFHWFRGDFKETDLLQKFLSEFAKRGVNLSKIKIAATFTNEEYFEKLQSVDLILDTFPFTGMTTTAEALSLGTPTLTMLGDLMPHRFSGTCINAIGDENLSKNFIFSNENDFVNQAVFFANNPQKLNELKDGLAEKARKSPLCDAELFAKNFEIKMLEVWDNFLNS